MFAADDAENMTDFFKASLIGVDYDVEYSRKLDKKYSALSLVINARAAADSQDMSDIVSDALDSVSVKYNLKIKTFFMETFGMMEEGKRQHRPRLKIRVSGFIELMLNRLPH